MKLLFIGGYISSDIVRAVCWTLLHSLWQGLLAAAIAGIIILTTRHSKAALRYNLLSIVFIGFIICTLITFLYQPGIINLSFADNTKANISLFSTGTAAINDAGKNWIPSIQKKTFFQPVIYYGNKYSLLITGLWAIFFFVNIFKMLTGLRYAYRLRYLQTFAAPQEWKERLYTLGSLLGIHHRVLLKESGIIKVPLVVGFLKPVILVPIGMFAHLSVEQVETIFVHELAHIRRKDFAVNLLQRFAEAVFFFNPFIVWMSSLIHDEREACCDDIVLEYTTDKKSYLEALVSFREPSFAVNAHAMALGGHNSLLNRAKRILTNENKKLNVMEKLTLVLVVVAITAFSFIPEKKNKLPLHPKAVVVNPADELKSAWAKRFGTILTTSATQRDTTPSKAITFKNISTYNNEDEKGNTREVKASGSDGKKYSYKTLNDEITEFEIDGVSVGKENFKKYDYIIEKIEDNARESMLPAMKKQQEMLQLLQSKQLLMKEQQFQLQKQSALLNDSLLNALPQTEANLESLKAQQFDLQKKNQLLLENKLNLQSDAELNKDLALLKAQQFDIQSKNQLFLENKLNLGNEVLAKDKLDLLKNEQLSLEKQSLLNNNLSLQRLQSIQSVLPNDEIKEIIGFLSDAGVIKDGYNLSFTLNFDELIVNGKKQDSKLHKMLKENFIKGKKDHYIYKTSGQPGADHYSTSTDISKD